MPDRHYLLGAQNSLDGINRVFGGLSVSREVRNVFVVATLMSVFLPNVSAADGTPDGVPPPKEHICDFETGAAYGLCTAYCEAMDCSSDAPSASEVACQKVAETFEQVTGRGVPCGPSSCWLKDNPNFTKWNDVVYTGAASIAVCNDSWLGGDPRSLAACGEGGPECPYKDGPPYAAVWYSGDSPFAGDNGDSLKLDESQYSLCRADLESAIMLSGVECY
jgi:hypothetical protein